MADPATPGSFQEPQMGSHYPMRVGVREKRQGHQETAMATATTAKTEDTYKPAYWAYIMLPLMGVIFGVFAYYTRGGVISKTFPYFHSFVVLFVMITMERIWMYRKAVSQKHMIWRDHTSTMVQTFLVGGGFCAIVLPIL